MSEHSTALTPFNFGDQPIRIEDRNGEPWFVLSDVCRVLEISNVGNAAARLDDDERDDIALADAIGRTQRVVAVNESGLYRLVLRSRKPSAKRFGKWVTGDVLPSIRRMGSYGQPAQAIDLNDTATLHRLLLSHTGKMLASEERIAELEPKAQALETLTNAGEGSLPVTHAAKVLSVRPGRLFDWLEASGWLYRGAEGLMGYQVRIDQGLIEHKAHRVDRGARPAKLVTRVLLTAKGIARLAELGAGR